MLRARLVPTLRAATAAELCGELPLSAEAGAILMTGAPTPAEFLDALVAAELWSDAVLFLAHALDVPDAIWWGLVCALVVERTRPDPSVGTALDVVGDWSLSPSPELEDEARAIADELEIAPPAAWVALAVSWSRAPERGELPARYRMALTVAIVAAVEIAATLAPREGAHRDNIRFYLERGFDIARGGDGGVDRLDPPMFPGARRNPRVPRIWMETP